MPPITTIASSSPENGTDTASADDEVGQEAQQRAGEAGDDGREDEGGKLVTLDRIALERRTQLVLADRDQHMPERRARQAQQQKEHRERDQRDKQVVGEGIVEIDRSDAAALEAAKAILAAGHIGPAERDRIGESGQRERQQREINAAPAQDQEADDERQGGDKDNATAMIGSTIWFGEPVQLGEAPPHRR